MKRRGRHSQAPASLTYWACPHGDARLDIGGDFLDGQEPLFALLGMEPGPWLFDTLPRRWLEDLETAVEEHEAKHLAPA